MRSLCGLVQSEMTKALRATNIGLAVCPGRADACIVFTRDNANQISIDPRDDLISSTITHLNVPENMMIC